MGIFHEKVERSPARHTIPFHSCLNHLRIPVYGMVLLQIMGRSIAKRKPSPCGQAFPKEPIRSIKSDSHCKVIQLFYLRSFPPVNEKILRRILHPYFRFICFPLNKEENIVGCVGMPIRPPHSLSQVNNVFPIAVIYLHLLRNMRH